MSMDISSVRAGWDVYGSDGEKVPGERTSPDGGGRGRAGDGPDGAPGAPRSSSGSTLLGVGAYLLLAVVPLLWRMLRGRGRS